MTTKRGKPNPKLSKPPSLLDKELRDPKQDAFGHVHFVDLLESHIESHEPPYSIGLLGKRGIGKSTIKALYEQRLADKPSKSGLKSITFNAWRYGSENIKRALLRHLFLELDGNKEKLDDALFSQIQNTINNKRTRKEQFFDLGQVILELFAPIIVFGLVLGLFIWFLTTWFQPDQQTALAWIGSISIAVLGLLGRHIIQFNQTRSKRAPLVKIDHPVSSIEQYEDLLIDQILIYKKKSKSLHRLIIFVDDLDRLSAEEMVQGIEAIQAFMELPPDQLDGLGIIFIISCDEAKIAEALWSRSKKSSGEVPATVSSLEDARNYLQRIFKFRVEIPPLPSLDMRGYANNILNNRMKDLKQVISNRGDNLDIIIERLIHVGVKDPRAVLNLLNTFADSYWLAEKREALDGSNKVGGLSDGSVTGHPVSLAALTALRVSFPEFYRDLERDQNLINRFESAFIHKQKLSSIPEYSRNILKNYGKYDSDNDVLEILERYRPLSRLIRSFEGLQWPRSLQPLLLFSQDPITRRLGDGGIEIYESLVSNDQEGLLRAFARDLDKNQLSDDHVTVIRTILATLYQENEVRQDNAYSVIAKILDRIPQEKANDLISKLVRRLTASKSLRTRVGFPLIESIVKRALPNDRMPLVDQLTLDFMRQNEPITFTTPSGLTPSLEEIKDYVHRTVEVLFWTKKNDSLSISAAERLKDWLKTRPYKVSDDESFFPFSELESWAQTYEDEILEILDKDYPNLLAEELSLKNPNIPNLESALKRCNEMFDLMYSRGEEDRAEVWSNLEKLLKTSQFETIKFSYEYAKRHSSKPSVEEKVIGSFIAQLSATLNSQEDLNNKIGLDDLEGLVTLAESRKDAAKYYSGDLGELISGISLDERFTDSVKRLSEIIFTSEPIHIKEFFSEWRQNLLTQLPEDLVSILGQNFGKLTDEQKQELCRGLTTELNPNSMAEYLENYKIFLLTLDAESLLNDKFRAHALAMSNHLSQSNIAQWDHFRLTVFSAFPILLKALEDSQLGTTLHNYFGHFKNVTEELGWSHSIMMGHWPKNSPTLSPYNPNTIFDQAAARVSTDPSGEGIKKIIASMTDMIMKEIVDDSNRQTSLIKTLKEQWSYNQDTVKEAFLLLKPEFDPTEIADLADDIDWQDTSSIQHLKEIWEDILKRIDTQNDVAIQLLKREPAEASETDVSFRLWSNIQPENKVSYSVSLLEDHELPEESRRRVLSYLISLNETSNTEEAMSIVTSILSNPNHFEVLEIMLENKQNLEASFTNQSLKNQLADLLIDSISKIDSTSLRQGISVWLRELRADRRVNNYLRSNEVSEDIVNILREHLNISR